MTRREHRVDDALARRRKAREHVDLDAEAIARLRRAREVLGVTERTER